MAAAASGIACVIGLFVINPNLFLCLNICNRLLSLSKPKRKANETLDGSAKKKCCAKFKTEWLCELIEAELPTSSFV